MDRSQWYIGAQNGVVLCVDHRTESGISGRFYHSYDRKPVLFSSADELIFQLEDFFNALKFPYPSTNERYFQEVKHDTATPEKKVKSVKDNELLQQHGDLGTFIIRVQHRQNSSWQGRITWMDKNKTLHFRSIWEMIKLIANALETVSVPEEEEEQTWD